MTMTTMGRAASTTPTTSQNEAPPSHIINFACGHPDANLLPVQQIADATRQALVAPSDTSANALNDNYHNGRQWLQYGREDGNYDARRSIAEFITTNIYTRKTGSTDKSERPAIAVDPDTLCLTSGVSHAIQLVVRTLMRLHNTGRSSSLQPICFVEDPTYFLVPPILEQSGYKVQPVKTNPDAGLDLEALKEQFEGARRRQPSPETTTTNDQLLVLYCIPTHHNPLGVSLSKNSRTVLLELCRSYNVYLIADEVYLGLTWASNDDKSEIVSMMEILDEQCPSTQQLVISVSAFTKILCPGIRCGWIHTRNQQLLQSIRHEGVLDSGGCTSQLSSGIVRQLIINQQLESYLIQIRNAYAGRCRRLCRALQEISDDDDYPFTFQFTVPNGGYFIWVLVDGVPFALDNANFRAFCLKEHNVDFKTGISCSSSSSSSSSFSNNDHTGQFTSCMRLCFAYYDSEILVEGVQRLCRAMKEYASQ